MLDSVVLNPLPVASKEIFDCGKDLPIWLFKGEMGAGKTTLISEICSFMGVQDTVSSPTFSLVNEYLSPDYGTIFHFDFYRINHLEEALDIGIDEYLESGNYCFIEWPEKVAELLPEQYFLIDIRIQNDQHRTIDLQKHGEGNI